MRKKKPPLTNDEGEVRELTWDDIRHFKRAEEIFPPEFLALLPKRKVGERGPQKTPVKEQVTLRLDPQIVAFFKTGGPGWQSRINDALLHVIRK